MQTARKMGSGRGMGSVKEPCPPTCRLFSTGSSNSMESCLHWQRDCSEKDSLHPAVTAQAAVQ